MEERPGAAPLPGYAQGISLRQRTRSRAHAHAHTRTRSRAHALTLTRSRSHALLFFNLLNKTESIFSSASCEASQLATGNYTHCQSPFCYLGDTETAPGREQVPALCPHPGGHLIRRPDFGRDFGMGASAEPSRASSWFQTLPPRVEQGRRHTAARRRCGGENRAGGCTQPGPGEPSSARNPGLLSHLQSELHHLLKAD